MGGPGQKVDGFGVMKSDLSMAVICPLSVQLCGSPVTDIAIRLAVNVSIIHDHEQCTDVDHAGAEPFSSA